MSNTPIALRRVAGRLAAGLCALAALSGAAWGEPGREGEGARREALKKMELAAFPADAWSKLSEWTDGKAITAGEISGKPVLILTWSSWHPQGSRAFAIARRAAEKYGKQGLIVVAAHHEQGWKDADRPAPAPDTQFHIAYDSKGEFRKAIQSDQDPDFYVIDRSGQLRYADILTDSVDEACKIVAGETSEDAAGIAPRLAKEREDARLQAAKSDAIRQGVDLRSLPEIPFTPPRAEAYEKADWPPRPRDPNAPQGQASEPTAISLPDGPWFPERPKFPGRAAVVYFWNPRRTETVEPTMRDMDLLQRQHGRDLVVVGVYMPFRDPNQQAQPGQNPERDEANALIALRESVASRQLDHFLVPDLAQGVFTALRGQGNSGTDVLHPYAAVVSSDGLVRWHGPVRSAGFSASIDKVLAVDPGVRARRSAEERYLRERGK